MQTDEELQTWEILLACQSQIRIAPSGHILGIDMNVAFRMAEARGWDLEFLSELLPEAELGMIEALSDSTASDPGKSSHDSPEPTV